MEIFISIAALFALNFGLYYKTISFGLVMDDFQWWQSKRSRGLLTFLDNGKFFWYRAKACIEDRLYGGTTFGLNIKVEHVFKIFLHSLVCVLMYLAMGHDIVSLGAAALYACNAVNNQTSCWLNGRRYVVNIILVLLMMIFPISSLILYPLTVLLQVTAIFTPVLLASKSPWYLMLLPALLAVCWKRIKSKCDGRSADMSAGDLKTFKWTRLIVVVKTFGFFFWKMIFPQVCAMQYPDRVKWGLTEEGNRDAYKIDGAFVQGIFSFCVASFIFFLCDSPHKVWACFMVLSILQWSALIPVTQILSDRYCSLPNVFMMFFVSYFAHMTGIFYIPIMILLAAYYIICLFTVMPMYEDLTKWYQYHFRHFPAKASPGTAIAW